MTPPIHPPGPLKAPRPHPLRDPRVRAIAFQVLTIAALVWFFWAIFDNTLTNMRTRGITTGFAFLDHSAGFGILMSLIPYDETYSYGRTFVVGLLNTLLVSGLGVIAATLIGFVVGVARLSRNWLIAKLALIYVETLRNIPLLLQIFFWYFAVLRPLPQPRQSLELGALFFLNNRGFYMPSPIAGDGMALVGLALVVALALALAIGRWATRRRMATGLGFPSWRTGLALVLGLPLLAFLALGTPVTFDVPHLQGFNFVGGSRLIPEMVALLLALSMYTAAFIAEIVRSGILAVSHGQTEAAHSLGLKPTATLRLIVLPQALRVMIPPTTSQYLNLIKNSSLATAIGYPDLVSVFMGTTLNQTGQAVEIVGMTMAVYLLISLVVSGLMNWYNRAVALKER
ncbi:amino acid ABC transporter permease [Rhodospirillum rubrum F11]|uniref:Amino acid ABC transporter, permease protein, 3-TM region, His/Glu/Gln/Arg/opine n=3 Tax=Rhodospirillum rubrum TaxID=1085 RepID=Q2RVP1_RHORT|nr:amino acid ABC transporter permease [Rhodospirillum rubrum]ABC21804.1 Amino acid ABC transporter, permease protein, 3-TM region, His/Glu/Gln/Arg/opine [Rhodospirillum rubrum ATCC 11170]AEO47504.1 amino acid ABC transporter permease [Rhodospirillum rubrum F11]MBK5953361.1 amino acid ABC transporter permease [Rhodospirillum rubrum]QXG81467.1 amino acid ABC transporter permease [Rhodospirillum rubrum]